jgi:NhaP-type Na+/H+ or K+/H+ antiporter
MLFGVFGTIMTFIIYSALTSWLMSRSNDEDGIFLWQTNYTTGDTIPVNLSTIDILQMCALLCSTDVIAAISMVSYDKYPGLFSLLFGESVVNDAVTIILFNTIGSLKDIDMGKSTIPLMVG